MTYLKIDQLAGFNTKEQDKQNEEQETTENEKGIENHIKAGEHFAQASRHHYESAKLHTEGHHDKANESAFLAIGHAHLANEFQMLDAKHHIQVI